MQYLIVQILSSYLVMISFQKKMNFEPKVVNQIKNQKEYLQLMSPELYPLLFYQNDVTVFYFAIFFLSHIFFFLHTFVLIFIFLFCILFFSTLTEKSLAQTPFLITFCIIQTFFVLFHFYFYFLSNIKHAVSTVIPHLLIINL